MRIAVLGTGIMGAGMARSLLRADHQVVVWNRSRDKAEPLIADGASVVDTPADAVAEADVIVTMLYDTDAVLSVMRAALPARATEAVWVQSSTIGVAGTQQAIDLAAEAGVPFVDAPMLGTRKPAESGQLVVLAAGPDGVRERLEPVFDAVGSKTLWVSSTPGDASALKLACNAWVASITAATAQSVALAQGLGLDPALFLAAIKDGPVGSPYAQLKGRAMIDEEFDTQFALDGVRKDLGLISDAARAAGVSSVLLDALLGVNGEAAARGHGGDDMAAVIKAF